jgi:peptidoglycan/LPS O-acetylase OafA/YrhL
LSGEVRDTAESLTAYAWQLTYRRTHGLRAVAALSVVAFHWYQIFPVFSAALGAHFSPTSVVNPTIYIGFGWIGVPLFFVLSGYILGGQVFKRCLTSAFLAKFWRRRLTRIYPAVWVHLVFLLLGGLCVPRLLDPSMWNTLFWQFTLWINMPPNMQAPISNVMWTLPIELSFYLILPFIGALSRRVDWRLLLLSALVITLGWRTFVMTWQQVPHYTAVLPWLDLLPGTLFTFMVGYSLNFLPENVSRRLATAGLLTTTAVFLGLLQWQLTLDEVYWTGHWILVVWPACIAASLGAMVYFCSRPAARIEWLSHPIMICLGNISFGIYLWHYPIMRGMFYLFEDEWISVSMSALALPLALSLTLPVATLSYRFIERPLMGWR